MIPMNFLRGADKPADYIVSGSWGEKAAHEAKKEGQVNIAWSGKATNYIRLPAAGEPKLSRDSAYIYITSNETIQGVQFQTDPVVWPRPLICDASSDFLSRPVDVAQYGMIYACAKKRRHRGRHRLHHP